MLLCSSRSLRSVTLLERLESRITHMTRYGGTAEYIKNARRGATVLSSYMATFSQTVILCRKAKHRLLLAMDQCANAKAPEEAIIRPILWANGGGRFHVE